MSAIKIKNLIKEFNTVKAVDNLNLIVNKGEMFGLVGPDGAGKSTIIRLLCGVITPTGGTAEIVEFDIIKQSEEVKRRIGYMSQQFSLYGDLTVEENLHFFAELYGVPKNEYPKRKERLLNFTRLMPFKKRLAARLSGGMKQKLGLACTLIHTPQVLFLDEPTTGVDPVSRREFWHILHDLRKQQVTIFMTTPYMDEAERCSRVALLHKGKIIALGTPSELKSQITKEIISLKCDNLNKAKSILEKIDEKTKLEQIQIFGDKLHIFTSDITKAENLIRKILNNSQIEIQELKNIQPSIEDVFINLIKH